MKAALAMAAAVIAAHYLPAPIAARMDDPDTAVVWLEHIAGSVEAAVALALLAVARFTGKDAWSAVGLMACVVGVIEESQVAFCSALRFGSTAPVPLWSGQCVELVGPIPYALVAASLIVILWNRLRDNQN